jgi:hypothetical protein
MLSERRKRCIDGRRCINGRRCSKGSKEEGEDEDDRELIELANRDDDGR